jgi:hypothetical protein
MTIRRLSPLDPLIINFRSGLAVALIRRTSEASMQHKRCSMIDHMLALYGEQAA